MTRIKYRRKLFLESFYILETGPFLAGSIWLSVILNPNNLTYNINNGNKTIKSGTANNLVSLKRKAKTALKELGVIFLDEIRKGSRL